MTMRIDDARHERAALAVLSEIQLFRPLVLSLQLLFDLASVVDQQCIKPLDLALVVQSADVDIIPQPAGRSSSVQSEGNKRGHHQPGFHLNGPITLLIRAWHCFYTAMPNKTRQR